MLIDNVAIDSRISRRFATAMPSFLKFFLTDGFPAKIRQGDCLVIGLTIEKSGIFSLVPARSVWKSRAEATLKAYGLWAIRLFEIAQSVQKTTALC
jgi:hypothetical protein